MRTRFDIPVAVSLALLVGLTGCTQKSERAIANDEVHTTWQRFKDAVVRHDGEAAANEMCTETIEHYGRIRDAALKSPPEELRKLPLDIQLTVLILRDRISGEELAALNGRSLAAVYVSRGWINGEGLRQISLGNIINKGTAAEARYADSRGMSRHRLVFRKEGEAWKFDFSATRGPEIKTLEALREREHLSKEALLTRLLSESAGNRPADELWLPLLPSEG